MLNARQGKSRAEVVLPEVQALNPTCKFSIAPALTDDVILKHTALVITQPMVQNNKLPPPLLVG